MLWAEALPGARSGMGTKGAAPAGAGGSAPRVFPTREGASQQLRVPTPCRSPSGLVASFPSRRQRPQSPLVSLIRASQGSVFLPPGAQGLRAVAACGSRSLPSLPHAALPTPCPTLPPSLSLALCCPFPAACRGPCRTRGPARGRGRSVPPAASRCFVCVGCRPPLPGAGLPQPALVLPHTLFPEPPLPAQRLVNKSPNPALRELPGEQSSCSDQFFTSHPLTASRLTVTRRDVPHAARPSLNPF